MDTSLHFFNWLDYDAAAPAACSDDDDYDDDDDDDDDDYDDAPAACSPSSTLGAPLCQLCSTLLTGSRLPGSLHQYHDHAIMIMIMIIWPQCTCSCKESLSQARLRLLALLLLPAELIEPNIVEISLSSRSPLS